MKTKDSYNKGKAGSGKKGKAFNLVITVLSVTLAVMILITVAKFIEGDHYDYVVSSNSLLRTVKNGYYAEAVQDMHANIVSGKTDASDPEYAIPYALSDYFESASYYYAYNKAAENPANSSRSSELKKKAELFKNNMDTDRSKTEDLSFIIDEMDLLFK